MLTNPATRWLILGWCTLTIMFAFAIPTFALPVLFFEMAADLDLDILQLGVVWGTMSLTAMVIGLVGGTLGDRFGTRRTIGVACLLTGMFGALRGAVPSYGLLVVSFLLYGLIAPGIPPNVHKTGASFFPKRRGLSAGTISVGMALALFIGVRFSATGLSPWIGGWRNVLFLYGAISATFGLIWLFIVPDSIMPAVAKKHTPMMESLRHIIQLRELWIIGIGALVFWGCYRGFIGYLPTYLRNVGWTATDADNTLSLLYLSSLILVLPLSMLSDRFNNRKFFMQ